METLIVTSSTTTTTTMLAAPPTVVATTTTSRPSVLSKPNHTPTSSPPCLATTTTKSDAPLMMQPVDWERPPVSAAETTAVVEKTAIPSDNQMQPERVLPVANSNSSSSIKASSAPGESVVATECPPMINEEQQPVASIVTPGTSTKQPRNESTPSVIHPTTTTVATTDANGSNGPKTPATTKILDSQPSNVTSNSNTTSKPKTNRRTEASPSKRIATTALPSKCTRTMGSSLFPRPCLSHSPTLQEIQSMSFSDYIREVVLAKALPKFEDSGEENDYSEDEWTTQQMPLTQGIGKVTLPNGFWNEQGIGNDRTGRGPAWQKGQPLGDLTIEMPIAQHVRGMAGVYEYTFTEVPQISVADFRDRADSYRTDQVGKAHDENDNNDENNTNEEDRLIQLDRHFWKRLGPTMPPAWYGADQEGTLFGDDPASGWSLGELDSCLHVLSRVPGVTTPYLYAGMWASAFCAHTEDMNLLSINFLHAGAPKIWYAIAPGPDAKRFEALCEFQYSVAARTCKEFMRHKRHLISPMVLQKAGIKYTTAVQRPGDAIITFPGGYHFGFNTGFNMAEATNFGVPEWIPYGQKARVCLCRPDSVRIDMCKLVSLLQLYESDQARTRIRSWKEWSRRREEKKRRAQKKGKKSTNSSPVGEKGQATGASNSKKRKLMSEQEKKNEFWIEVVKPATTKVAPAVPARKPPKEVVQEEGRGKRQKKKTLKAAMWKEESKKEPEKPPEHQEPEVWHLAKPIGRKGIEIGARVLCLQPGTMVSGSMDQSNNMSEDDEDEQCFRGSVVERVDDNVKIHLDGLSKSEDVWVSLDSKKVYLDGGPWVDDHEACAIPYRHYWKEMDSKTRCGDE